jgi:TRAP-type C4-dicarboxylate transport system permease small subunit
MRRIAELTARVSMALAAICFAGFIVMVIAQVAYRYLGVSMVFSEDAARLLNLYAVFLGLVMIVHAQGDVRIDLIDRVLAERPRARAVFGLFYNLAMALLLAAIAWGSYLLMVSNWGLILPAISFLHQGHLYFAPFIGTLLSIVALADRVRANIELLRGRESVRVTAP